MPSNAPRHKTSQTAGKPLYPYTPFRVEFRPTYGPHSKDELLRILDQLAEAGIKAWWYSVASKGSYPMFPSKYLPHRSDTVDYFPWLVEQAHQRGISIFSWEYLTTAPLLGEAHPDWRWQFFDWSGPKVERDKHYLCLNSPYGQLLKDYCIEVVDELGFDGIWFDGSFLHGHGASGTFACCCPYCAEKYSSQTGRPLPKTIDLRDDKVREYLEWRYFDNTQYWRELSAYVRERAPQATIAYNYFNRLESGIECGSPLRRMADDAPQWPTGKSCGPMEAMISAEIGHWPQQTLLLSKILRAVNDNYPVELWAYGRDSFLIGSQNLDPSPLLLHAYMCATTGGFASVGIDELEDRQICLKVLSDRLGPLAEFIPGETEKTVGLVVSGCSKDYGYIDEEHPMGHKSPAWNSSLGMSNLLNALRLPHEVLLDNMLSEKFLAPFSAIVLPDVRCLSDEAIIALQDYVNQGGTLMVVGEVGLYDQMGRTREQGALDSLFGITWRDDKTVSTPIRFDSTLTGSMDPNTGIIQTGVPAVYQLPGSMRLLNTDKSETLGTATYNEQLERIFTPNGIQRPAGKKIEGSAILRRKLGSGQLIWISPNIAEAYGEFGPNRYSRALVDRLLSQIKRPFTVVAPANVTVNLIHQEGREVLHVLNVPDSMLTLGISEQRPWPNFQVPQDCVPTGPISIIIPAKPSKIHSPSETAFEIDTSSESETRIIIPRLELYSMIVLEK